MQAASRWNEGKLHLGYTYTGTDSLDTARLMLSGTAHFEKIVTAVCGRRIEPQWWSRPVIYLVDPDSIFSAEQLWARAVRVEKLLRDESHRCESLTRFAEPRLARLAVSEARAITHQERVAMAWITGERALAPRPVAEMIVDAVKKRRIETLGAKAVAIVRRGEAWAIECQEGPAFISRGVMNCSWESQAWLDRTQASSNVPLSIRYKVALFGSDQQVWSGVSPSTRILGAFGDVTPYGNGDVYLSWYPAGLVAQSNDAAAPPIKDSVDDAAVTSATLAGLGLNAAHCGGCIVAGGYVVARGAGQITDRRSTLHERHRPNVSLLAPNYVSVDSGKYNTGAAVRATGSRPSRLAMDSAMTQPAVTVLIPAYRSGQRLVGTLESLAQQTCRPVKVELSFDAAPGYEPPPLPEVPGLHVRYQPQQWGWVAHVNLLLQLVDTPYFMLLYHDDAISPGYIAAAVAALETDSAAAVAHGSVRYPRNSQRRRGHRVHSRRSCAARPRIPAQDAYRCRARAAWSDPLGSAGFRWPFSHAPLRWNVRQYALVARVALFR
jgi:hypothetical protein